MALVDQLQPAHIPGSEVSGMATGGMGLAHQQAGIHIGAAARRFGGFAVVLLGMLAIATWFVPTTWCWLLWPVLGLAAGVVVGRGRDVWLVAVGALAFYPMAAALGLPTEQPEEYDWFPFALVNAVGAFLVAAGFVIGTLAWVRPAAARIRDDADTRPASARLTVTMLVLGILALAAWVAYSAVAGSNEMVTPSYTTMNQLCGTPMTEHRWTYEAINYDQADDARLPPPDSKGRCASQGTAKAGSAVVSADGTRLAGWYIPAASGVGTEAPTVVVVPGWKSNKSEMLKYAEAFHDDFNLLLFDLRYTGRSGGTQITWGIREREDVRAMIDWLEREKHPTWIGSMGDSMGAASALAEAVGDDRVRALILDSMHASVETSFADGLSTERRLPGYPTAWAMINLSSFRIGQDIAEVYPTTTIGKVGDRPILLLHGAKDTLDLPEHSADLNQAAAQAAGVSIERHDCPTGAHGTVVDECRTQWATWVNDFLAPLVAKAD